MVSDSQKGRKGKKKKGKKGGSDSRQQSEANFEVDDDLEDDPAGSRPKGKKKKKGKLKSREPAKWTDVNFEADKRVSLTWCKFIYVQYFNVIGDETEVASLNEDK